MDIVFVSDGTEPGKSALSGDVECDEVYVTAAHKGNPEAVRKKGAKDDVTDSKGFGVEVRSKRKSHQFLA